MRQEAYAAGLRAVWANLDVSLKAGRSHRVEVREVRFALVALAVGLENGPKTPSEQEAVYLVPSGGTFADAFDMLIEDRGRAAFQLRILAEESRALTGETHRAEFLERVRSFANTLDPDRVVDEEDIEYRVDFDH